VTETTTAAPEACQRFLVVGPGIWGNDPDGSELIADHTSNDRANDVWEEVARRGV
jgi:hypothetical protein